MASLHEPVRQLALIVVVHERERADAVAAIDDEIARLERILNTGADLVTVDGLTTRFDLDSVRSRLRDLYQQRDAASGGGSLFRKIRLSAGWQSD